MFQAFKQSEGYDFYAMIEAVLEPATSRTATAARRCWQGTITRSYELPSIKSRGLLAGGLRTGGRGCQLRRPTVSCKLPLGSRRSSQFARLQTGTPDPHAWPLALPRPPLAAPRARLVRRPSVAATLHVCARAVLPAP